MTRSQKWTQALSLISFLLVGCGVAPRVSVLVTRPAEINLKHIDEIAIGEIKGRGSGTMAVLGEVARVLEGGKTKEAGSKELAAELSEGLFGSERFEVLDFRNLKRRLSRRNLALHDATDNQSVKKTRELFGNIAVVSGEILRHDFDQNLTRDDEEKKDKKTGKVTKTQIYHRSGSATVSVMLRILDVGTSEVLATRKFTESAGESKSRRGSKPGFISSEPLFQKCRTKIVSSFVRMISPYTERVYVSFEKDKKMPELEQGFKMLDLGDWDGAIGVFKKATDTYSQSPIVHKAFYNLGLGYMYTDQFDKARTALEEAYAAKPSKKYQKSIRDLNKRIEDARRLEAQRQADPELEEAGAATKEEQGHPDTGDGE